MRSEEGFGPVWVLLRRKWICDMWSVFRADVALGVLLVFLWQFFSASLDLVSAQNR